MQISLRAVSSQVSEITSSIEALAQSIYFAYNNGQLRPISFKIHAHVRRRAPQQVEQQNRPNFVLLISSVHIHKFSSVSSGAGESERTGKNLRSIKTSQVKNLRGRTSLKKRSNCRQRIGGLFIDVHVVSSVINCNQSTSNTNTFSVSPEALARITKRIMQNRTEKERKTFLQAENAQEHIKLY